MRAVPERLRDASCGGARQIDYLYRHLYTGRTRRIWWRYLRRRSSCSLLARYCGGVGGHCPTGHSRCCTRRFVADGVMHAVDNVAGRILVINLTTSSVSVMYRARDNMRPYTVASSQQYVYFSAWNRKSVRLRVLRLED